MTVKRLTFEAPYGCRWCGIEQRRHGRRWMAVIGMHAWMEPDQPKILERMLRRRHAHLNAQSTLYHATTGWAADHTGESADPYCADCKTDGCRLWMRIQAKLDRQRWRMSGMPYGGSVSGGWGGDEPWPF